jgi:hypothetical protein
MASTQSQPKPPPKTTPEPLPQTIFYTEKRGASPAEPPSER